MSDAPEGKEPRQLIFDLKRDPSFDRDDFLDTESNGAARAMIERWPDWQDRVLLLVGPPGCGKSHLGAIWAEKAGARTIGINEPLSSASLAQPPLAFIDDADRAGHAEAPLFHMLNLAREQGGWLLLTARTPPAQWNLRTPDLLSRLRLAPVTFILRPEPPLLRAVIVKLCADRQIRIDEDVVAYAVRHCEQSMDAVSRFVAAVDEASLAAGRRITRPLAVDALARLERDR